MARKNNSRALQKKIGMILFKPKKVQVVPEKLTIIILSRKAKFFRFLKAYTRWRGSGHWKQYSDKNIIIQVTFFDSRDNRYGRRLKNLLRRYNRLFVKEELLYFDTVRLSESPSKKELV